ncbi:MAG: hypothetical protein ACI3YD_03795 [Alloprevotella sp.]
MISNGFLLLPRHVLNSLVQRSASPLCHELALLDLLNMAHFAKRCSTVNVGRRSVTIGQGEVAASLKFLGNRWKWTASRVRRFLIKLAEQGEITMQKRCCTTIISITDYENKFARTISPEHATQGRPSTPEAGAMDAPAPQSAPPKQQKHAAADTTSDTTIETVNETMRNNAESTAANAPKRARKSPSKKGVKKLITSGKSHRNQLPANRGRKTLAVTTLKDLKKGRNETTGETTRENNKDTYKEKVRTGEDFLSEKKVALAPQTAKTVPKVKGKGQTDCLTPPSVEAVTDYCRRAGLDHVQPKVFVDYYEARGWMMGERPMRCWQAAVRLWNTRQIEFDNQNSISHEHKTQPFERLVRQPDAERAAGRPESGGPAAQTAQPDPLDRIWNLIGLVQQEPDL